MGEQDAKEPPPASAPQRPSTSASSLEDQAYQTGADRRQLGVTSAVFLIFNRMIGTGIFATPSIIFKLCGSPGLALFMWVVGALFAASGMAVYLEFGTGLPRNGGEKNYLEMVYKKPKYLATCMYTGYVILLGWAGSNSVVFGEYILHACQIEVTRWNQRGIGLACVTFAFLLHGISLKWGVRLQNMLGIFKLVVICIIIVSGWAALGGALKVDKPHNFGNAFEGTTGDGYAIVMAIYNVIWSFLGYNNANYALSETKNPVRTLKIAAPLALGLVSLMYMLCNISYLAAVSREELVGSGRILAATFFRNVFGAKAERALSVFVALSALGNVMSVIFSQGRLVQELGREGILPYSKFFSSNKPFNAPFVGLCEHWIASVVIMIAPPPGDAFSFIVNVITYPVSVINFFVAAGLLYIYCRRHKFKWDPPVRATIPVTIFFLIGNLYLIFAPFIPPSPGQSVYEHIPYYLHCVVGIGVILAGAVYWAIWALLLPWLRGYDLVAVHMLQNDGWSRTQFVRQRSTPPSSPTTFQMESPKL